ncbi:hypothetical protein E2C01_050757 [Portunus trituberculatus]|uniref:Uncharacterized protein n=1 Tax=Portunus trituberculatus TaxID=210409 RepID=A0A5B7G954_PORTR|nr:hypothetical protein [Portunus trituberculatus]
MKEDKKGKEETEIEEIKKMKIEGNKKEARIKDSEELQEEQGRYEDVKNKGNKIIKKNTKVMLEKIVLEA